MLKKLLFSLMAMLLSLGSYAQKAENSWTISINPSYFILGGYSVKGFYNFPKNWSVGLQSEGGFELPDFARDQFFDISPSASVDWSYAIGTEIRYRLTDSEIDKGFYVFGTLGYEGWAIKNEANFSDEFDNWFSSIGLGYNWYPFKKKGLQIGAAYNTIFILNNTSNRSLGDNAYKIRSVVPPSFAPSLSLGWRF